MVWWVNSFSDGPGFERIFLISSLDGSFVLPLICVILSDNFNQDCFVPVTWHLIFPWHILFWPFWREYSVFPFVSSLLLILHVSIIRVSNRRSFSVVPYLTRVFLSMSFFNWSLSLCILCGGLSSPRFL